MFGPMKNEVIRGHVTMPKEEFCHCNLKFHRLRVFENRVLRRVFGLQSGEVTGEWRRIHNKEHSALYSLNIIRVIKKIEMGRECSMYEVRRDAYRVLVGRSERKTQAQMGG
jgi:hypothetical protein